MRKHVMLAILLSTACASSKSAKQSTVRWKLPKGESWAYKFTAEATAVVDGEEKEARDIAGYVFIDADPDGRAEVRLEAGEQVFGQTSLELAPTSSHFFFPLPESPIGSDPLEQSLVIEGLGTTSTQFQPDLELSETLRNKGREGASVRLSFQREGKAAGEAPVGVHFEEEGSGTFDLERGRYERLERFAKMSVGGDVGGQRMDLSLAVRYSLEFDAAESEARTRARSKFQAAPVSPGELARYDEANPAEEEIAEAVRALEGGLPSPLLVFHLQANPVATWQEGMSLPADQKEAFLAAASVHLRGGAPLSDSLIAWLKRELPDDPIVARVVADIADERLREELTRLASGEESAGSGGGVTAKRARASLKTLEVQKKGPSSLLQAEDGDLMRVGHALQSQGQDHRGLIPVLIQLLERSVTASDASEQRAASIYVQWLEGLTSRSFGEEVADWKAFWKENQDKPYCQWLIDAAAQENQILANNALTRLASCEDAPEASEFLASLLEGDRDDARHLAALSLAEHEDERAVPVLLQMLAGDNLQLRSMALVALANFRDTALGYDPDGDDADRAAALRRWRAWKESVTTKAGGNPD